MDFVQTFLENKYDPKSITCCIKFSARCTKFMANVSLVLSDPIAISTCCIKFSARCTHFMANVSLVLRNPIAITCCVNFSARCTKFMANVRFFLLV